MRVVIAGGHGKIGLRLARLLGEREEHAIALVRSAEQEADVVALGEDLHAAVALAAASARSRSLASIQHRRTSGCPATSPRAACSSSTSRCAVIDGTVHGYPAIRLV